MGLHARIASYAFLAGAVLALAPDRAGAQQSGNGDASALLERAFENLYADNYVQTLEMTSQGRSGDGFVRKLQITRKQNVRPVGARQIPFAMTTRRPVRGSVTAAGPMEGLPHVEIRGRNSRIRSRQELADERYNGLPGHCLNEENLYNTNGCVHILRTSSSASYPPSANLGRAAPWALPGNP